MVFKKQANQGSIGLKGCNNLYQYAPNPGGWVDPLGLAFEGVNFAGSPSLFPTKVGQLNIVEIAMQGSSGRDFTEAFKLANISPADAKNFTWHHVRDFNPETGKTTMQFIRTKAHEATFPHSGSVEQFEKFSGTAYNSQDVIKFAEKSGWLEGRKPLQEKGNCCK